MKNRKKRNKVYLYLLVILGLTVGFALLSTTLNINGTAGIKKNTWDIHWDEESIQVTENSVQAETPTVTEEGQKVSYAVTLELPGDFYEFTIDAVNAGTVDGMVNIDGLTPTIKNKTTGEVTTLPSYIKYSVTYADGSPIEEFHKLAKRVDENTPTREKFKIRIEYDSQSSELPDDDKEFEIDDDLPYIPDDGRGKDRNSTNIVYQNYLGKSTTLDSSWDNYFKFEMGEENIESDIYSVFLVVGDNEINFYDSGFAFNSLKECNSFLEENTNPEEGFVCKVAVPKGKYATPINVTACMVTSTGETFCYDYDKYDCNYDENINECDNNSTYTLQKKDEIFSKGGMYTASYSGVWKAYGVFFSNIAQPDYTDMIGIHVYKDYDALNSKYLTRLGLDVRDQHGDEGTVYKCEYTSSKGHISGTLLKPHILFNDKETNLICYID